MVGDAEAGGEGAAAGPRGLELMHRGHNVHDTTIPDLADHPCGDVGDQIRRGRFDADLGDEDGSSLLGRRLMLEDDLLDPGSLTGDV